MPDGLKLEDLGLVPVAEPLNRSYSEPNFPYEGYFGRHSECAIAVFSGDMFDEACPHVVIATEVAGNPGTSVTNCIERVAEAYEKEFGLPHVFAPGAAENTGLHFVLIEHYDQNSYTSGRDGEDFSIVRFGAAAESGRGRYYSDPQWSHIDKSEVERLIGQEL